MRSYIPSDDCDYNYFSTGLVTDVNQKTSTCTIVRTEGGMLYNIPILNTMGGGNQSSDSGWLRSLRGNVVVMIPIHGVLYVLATVPNLAKAPVAIN